MQLSFINLLLTTGLFSSITLAQTTSYNAEQWSSASSAALKTDGPLFYAFLSDFNYDFTKYESYMDKNHMTYPANLQNYAFQLQSITDDAEMLSALESRSFPFSEFVTMFTKFEWASSLLSENGLSSVLMPSDFLTHGAEASVTSGSGSDGSSGSSVASITSSASSSESKSSTASSSASQSQSQSGSSSSSSSTSNSQSSSSANSGESLYIPIISFPLALASFFLL